MKALLILVLAALLLPATALGKGPSEASLAGPGGNGISFAGDGESGGSRLGDLTQQAGFFPAVFGQEPDPILSSRPKGDLGPRYTITYKVPGPNNEADTIRQDVYPYAKPAPVTYMTPGQKIFDMQTRGGWFQADADLKRTLVSAGLPARPSAGSSRNASLPTDLVGFLAAALLLAAATTFVVRRRIRPAQAA